MGKVKHQGGFSLLEILVAFAILALSLGVLLRIFGGGGQIAGLADDYARALGIAESLMASAGIETPLQPGETRGEIDENFHWTMKVTPFPVDESVTGPFDQPFRPHWVELSVEWGQDGEARRFELATLRLLSEKPMGSGAWKGGLDRSRTFGGEQP